MLVYISGPISGDAEGHKAKFEQAAEGVRKAGHIAVSPLDIPPYCEEAHMEDCPGDREHKFNGHTWECWLRGDIREMLLCDAILMLPGWETSRGAHLERMLATKLGMEPFYLSGV